MHTGPHLFPEEWRSRQGKGLWQIQAHHSHCRAGSFTQWAEAQEQLRTVFSKGVADEVPSALQWLPLLGFVPLV